MKVGILLCLLLAAVATSVLGDDSYDPVDNYEEDDDPCDTHDLIGVYTECSETHHSRSMSWAFPEYCNPLGMNLPDPVENLPCYQYCMGGTCLPFGGRRCQKCPAGEYSAGNGYNTFFWNKNPDEQMYWPSNAYEQGLRYRTYCADENLDKQDCVGENLGWVVQGWHTYSGPSSGLKYNEASVMQYNFKVSSHGGGVFQFQYSTGASNLDESGLYIRVNRDETVKWRDSPYYRNSIITFPPGKHKIRLGYLMKTDEPTPNHRVNITLVQISGFEDPEHFCHECPTGFYQDAIGKAYCKPCPTNTYSEIRGSTYCIPCPTGHSSQPGSNRCMPDDGK